jgi:hypothetical protein
MADDPQSERELRERGAEVACLNIAIKNLENLDGSLQRIKEQLKKSSQAPPIAELDGPTTRRSALDLHKSLVTAAQIVDLQELKVRLFPHLGYYAKLQDGSEIAKVLHSGFELLTHPLAELKTLLGKLASDAPISQSDLQPALQRVEDLEVTAISLANELHVRIESNLANGAPEKQADDATLKKMSRLAWLLWISAKGGWITRKGLAALLDREVSTLHRYRSKWKLPVQMDKLGNEDIYFAKDVFANLMATADLRSRRKLDMPASEEFLRNHESFCPRI